MRPAHIRVWRRLGISMVAAMGLLCAVGTGLAEETGNGKADGAAAGSEAARAVAPAPASAVPVAPLAGAPIQPPLQPNVYYYVQTPYPSPGNPPPPGVSAGPVAPQVVAVVGDIPVTPTSPGDTPRTLTKESDALLGEEMDAIEEVVELAKDWAEDGTTTPYVIYVLMNESMERTRRLYQMVDLLKDAREAAVLERDAMQKQIESLKAELEAARPSAPTTPEFKHDRRR